MDWKNDHLARQLYEQAARPNAFFDQFPLPPLTRWQRLIFHITDYRERFRRAGRALLGREDD